MRSLARVFAFGIIIIGVAGAVAPDRLIATAQYVLTPAGLYTIAALRVVMGLVLILAAPVSRAPTALRIIGGVILVSGLATPAFGLDRSRAVADWAANQGTVLLRSVGGLLVAIGAFIAFAAAPGPRS